MNARQLIHPAEVFVEIGQDVVKAVNGSASIEIPLERFADGRLTEACRRTFTERLRTFIDRKAWQPQARAYCAVGARGISLRVLSLPHTGKDELQRLLPLQIESEFPLPPEQLAWGFQALTRARAATGSNGTQEVLVAAVKKDVLEEYSGILAECGAIAVFTVAALARSYLCPQPPGTYAVLHLERNYSELITIENGVPLAVRVLSWGRENLLGIRAAQGNGRDESVALSAPDQSASFGGSGSFANEGVKSDAIAPLTRMMNGQALGRRIYVLGLERASAEVEFPTDLAAALGDGLECQRVDLPEGTAGSPAVLGLHRALERDPRRLPLVLELKQTNGKMRISRQASMKWAAAAVGLGLLAFLLPYAEALALKSHLTHKLAAIQSDQGRLAVMDRELDFLRYLKENEPPYVDALLVLAKAAPPGAHFDSVSMNRRGEVSLRGSLHDGQQVADLRSKLINSGFFAAVAVEEQVPTPDHQKVNVRMSAQWKASGIRSVPAVDPGPKSPRPGDSSGPAMPVLPSGVGPPPLSGPPVQIPMK